MQISKLFVVMGAVALCTSFVSVRADEDTPEQATARAALLKEMDAINQGQTNATATPAESRAETEAQAKALAALQEKMNELNQGQTPATGSQPAVTESQAEIDAQAKALAALQEKMNELNQGQTPESATAAGNQSFFPAPAATPSDTEAQAKALTALQEKLNELNQGQTPATGPAPASTTSSDAFTPLAAPLVQKPAEPVTPAPVVAKPSPPAKTTYPGKGLGFKPIEAPALPISDAKQAQLQELLAKYKADQITPDEYQKQRAAILAQP